MDVLKNKIVFFIVAYNENYFESVTFKTLIESFKNHKNGSVLEIYIYDNTPDESWVVEKKHIDDSINVNYFTQNKNKGISYAYNFLSSKAEENSKEWFVILDQDTALPIDFYKKYTNINDFYKIQCPRVYVGENLASPAFYKNYRSHFITTEVKDSIDLKDVSCINSGLLLNIEYFNSIGRYNEKIELDFCDHDFIDKVKKSGVKKIGIIDADLQQDFSYSTHSKVQALSRYKMFVRDFKEFKKGKNRIKLLFMVDLPHLAKLIYKYKSLKFISIRIA